MQKFLHQLSRFFIGGLFIFSGLIKLNDPVGTEIKLEEYFEVFAVDFGSFFNVFIPVSLELGMILIVLEIALGVAVLMYYRMKITTWVLLGLTLFFLFLTFYSAYFDKVTDCGCFGDAIKLTPWQSFWKDVVLLVFVAHLFWYRKSYVPVLRTLEGHGVIAATAVISLFTGVYAIRHLPYIDFRPYRIGNNIQEQMKAEEQPIIEYTFVKNGEEVKSQKYLLPEDGYTYKSSAVLNEDKIKPKITDYSVMSSGGMDLTDSTLQGTKLLIIIQDPNKASTANVADLRALVRELEGKIDLLAMTSGSEHDMETFRHENQLPVAFVFTDATVLKTMIRSNPGIILLRDGTVLGHWSDRDIPTGAEVFNLLSGK